MYSIDFPHGLMFHRVHYSGLLPSGQGSITDREFEKVLQYAGIENILSPDEWLYRLRNNALNESDLCITFDDGLKCQYEVCLPILDYHGIQAFWHVYSSVFGGGIEKNEVYSHFISRYFRDTDLFFEGFFIRCEEEGFSIGKGSLFHDFCKRYRLRFPFYSFNDIKFRYIRDRVLVRSVYEEIMDKFMREKGANLADISARLWMDDSDLRVLTGKGHRIGLHSYSHPAVISNLSSDQQCEEFKLNLDHIASVCNREVLTVAHPFGDYDADTLRILSELGIVCGFRSNMLPPEGGDINQSPLEIAREDCANILGLIDSLS